jgi:hypothetical protein
MITITRIDISPSDLELKTGDAVRWQPGKSSFCLNVERGAVRSTRWAFFLKLFGLAREAVPQHQTSSNDEDQRPE